jgi:DNA-binding NarL/FixJ family response regulator
VDNAHIRVLLADDDEGYLESLRILIDGQPELTVVGLARDGLEAVALAGSLDPDAAVIDLHMPQLDGAGAISQLRRNHPSLCLIALTGDPDPILHQEVSDAGADGVLLKGEMISALFDRLNAMRR